MDKDVIIVISFFGLLGFLAFLVVSRQPATLSYTTASLPPSYVKIPQGLR